MKINDFSQKWFQDVFTNCTSVRNQNFVDSYTQNTQYTILSCEQENFNTLTVL